MINPRSCHFVCKDGREVGFCFGIEDPFSNEKTMVMKTIGILPEFRKSSLGSALIHFQHKDLEDNGYKKIVYALMRQGNIASNINPYGARVFRQYEVYRLPL
jgi:N-acetylglutamate synthase-like GNAT family acetyltransferase